MDVHCTNCLEPWDTESVRFARNTVEPGWTFKDRKSFTILACPCCKANGRLTTPATGPRADMIRTVSDLSGHDLDGLAADLDDFKWIMAAMEAQQKDTQAPSLKTHRFDPDSRGVSNCDIVDVLSYP